MFHFFLPSRVDGRASPSYAFSSGVSLTWISRAMDPFVARPICVYSLTVESVLVYNCWVLWVPGGQFEWRLPCRDVVGPTQAEHRLDERQYRSTRTEGDGSSGVSCLEGR